MMVEPPPPPPVVDGSPAFAATAPRRSTRVTTDLTDADGDTWRERVAVCEGINATDGSPRLVLRSYFRNRRTGQRVWDEPPSGASNILFATSQERQKADKQLQELKVTLDMIPKEEDTVEGTYAESMDNKKKKGGFFRRLRSSGNNNKMNVKGRRQQQQQMDDNHDLNLQRAIARSMADQRGGNHTSEEPLVYFDSGQTPRESGGLDEDDEELAMAKALSMSESNQNTNTTTTSSYAMAGDTAGLSEEEMLQIALEESRLEAERTSGMGAATGKSPYETSESTPLPDANLLDDPEMDRKMPALKNPPEPPTEPGFDPYAPSTSDVAAGPGPSLKDPPPAAFAAAASAPDAFVPESEKDTGKSASGRRIGRRLFGGGRKAMEEEAGVV